MSQDDFLTKIRLTYPHLTKAEKKVADFILQHSSEVLFMSITDLADACKVGETTVFRFCRSMNLQGYQEFKIYLSLSLKNKDKTEGQEFVNDNIGTDDSFEIMVQKMLNSSIDILRATSALLQEEKVTMLVEKMIAAERIFFFGVGNSQIMAMMLANKFLRISSKFFCYSDSHMQTMVASTLTEKDVAIVISYSGSTKDSILLAKHARNSGAYVACITRFAKSPLTNLTDVVILCGANEGPMQGGSTTAIMSQVFIMEVLYLEYYRKTYNSSYANNQKTSQSIIDKMY